MQDWGKNKEYYYSELSHLYCGLICELKAPGWVEIFMKCITIIVLILIQFTVDDYECKMKLVFKNVEV